VERYRQELGLKAVLAVKTDRREHGMCGEDSLNSTNCLRLDKPKLFSEKKVHQQLLEDGFKVSLNTVAHYRQELDLRAVLAVKQVNTTIPINKAKKF
jgi:hypothetical protein